MRTSYVTVNMESMLQNMTQLTLRYSNLSTVIDEYESLNDTFDFVFGIVSLTMMPFVILGNFFVIFSLLKYKRLQTTTNMFIGSLAFSDLMLGLATLPIYTWFYLDREIRSSKMLCLLKFSSVIFSMSSSLINLVVIAYDRYIAILHPLKYPILMTKRKAKIIIACVWVYHSIICSLPSLGWNEYDKYNGTLCDFFVVIPRPYTMFTTPVTILVGLLISLYLYLQIYKVAVNYTSKLRERKSFGNQQFKKDTKSAKAMGIILFFFFIFWVPFMLAGPLKYVNISTNLMNIIKNFALTLAMSNSMINPFIYCWLRKDFKCAFQELLRVVACHKIPKPDWGKSIKNSKDDKISSRSSLNTLTERQITLETNVPDKSQTCDKNRF